MNICSMAGKLTPLKAVSDQLLPGLLMDSFNHLNIGLVSTHCIHFLCHLIATNLAAFNNTRLPPMFSVGPKSVRRVAEFSAHQGLKRLQSRCLLGGEVLAEKKTCFQDPSDCWQHSSPCSCQTEGVSFLLESTLSS